MKVGNQAKTSVGVILEAKKPTNKSEMIFTEKVNAKVFQELVLYYLRERITHKNLEVLICKQNPAADTSELEKQIDQLVYELYGLTEEEIGIVEG